MNIADNLFENKEKILAIWKKKIENQLPALKNKNESAILDHIPHFFDCLITKLSQKSYQYPSAKELEELASHHGKERSALNPYSTDQIVIEYQLLEQTIIQVLEQKESIKNDDRNIIHDFIFLSIRNAIAKFDEIRNEKMKDDQSRLLAINEDLNYIICEKTADLDFKEQLFKYLVEGVKDYAIFTLDPHGFITSWNAGAQRMKGYTSEEAVGQHFSMLYPEEGKIRDEPMGHLRVAAKEGRSRGEGIRIRKSGELYLADVLITAMHSSNGGLLGFSKVVQDLTEYNQLIQERDLSRSLSNELQIEKDMREKFVAALTHDLRGPVTAAKINAQQIIRQSHPNEKFHSLANKTVQTLNRCEKMINDLLDSNKLQAGETLPLKIERCDLRDIVNTVCEQVFHYSRNRFFIESEETVSGHWSSEGLHRILENLISNAIKYGDAFETVRITLKKVKDRVLLSVHNKGKAITPEDKAKLFLQYYRGKNESHTQRGWGLGLTIVRGLCESMGGIIKVESYPIHGTTFTIDLPQDARPFQNLQ